MATRLTRRGVLAAGGAAVAAGVPVLAGARPPVPETKTVRGLRKLMARGEPDVYSADELRFIGMPVGGLFAGTVYLGGDGQLWNWDVFNQEHLGCVDRTAAVFMGDTLTAMQGANYVDPVRQQSPFNQQFRLILEGERPRTVRFGDIRFRGEYPIGRVEYTQADADVEMTLEAFSPFCPLEVEDSSFPATTQTYKVKNVGTEPLDLRLQYQTENPVLAFSRKKRDDYVLRGEKTDSGGVRFSAERRPGDVQVRPDVRFEDWSSGTYGKWVATGTAFGTGPQGVKDLPGYMGPVRAETEFVVNTHQTRNGEGVVQADEHTGSLTSPKFVISRRFVNLRIGGGSHAGTCVNLLVDGKVVRTASGKDSNAMGWESFGVSEFEGKEAQIEVLDRVTTGWGQISLGEVVFADLPSTSVDLETLSDFGTFCVEVAGGSDHQVVSPTGGEVGRRFRLAPGQTAECTFVVAWHFPNCARNLPGKHNWYAKRWKDAEAVADDLIARWPSLQARTRKWNRTWYDSTLPFWFLDRTFVNTSTLATTTCHRLDEGRFYFWEGVGCCPGTCTHVWGYAQAAARVFPEVERYLRQAIDFGLAYRKDTGAIDYRAEYHQVVAVDGHASCILRAYREHQMARSDAFLRSIYPQVRGAMQHLIDQDPNRDGILDGAQYNTLDTAWYGEIAWISSLYIAALRASEAMATEMGDSGFAATCKGLAEKGSERLVSDLFNGEYFVNKADPEHPEANNTRLGCHLDQIYGQSWAHQVGLPRVVPAPEARSALKAMFKHNFMEDVWEYRRKNHAVPGGRWYATPKEPGLIVTSFPKGDAAQSIGKGGDAWAVMYFNESWTGFEGQVAGHMIAEGLVAEGMTVMRAVHERYHASKRNPYNEVECSDHYGRAMSTYGAYVSMTGFQNDGPRGKMSHRPQAKGLFRCAFINERGWGTYERSASGAETVKYEYEAG